MFCFPLFNPTQEKVALTKITSELHTSKKQETYQPKHKTNTKTKQRFLDFLNFIRNRLQLPFVCKKVLKP
ncbi:hypothetical protein [Helicobacter sp.]|uniref:hypothetical protein n=1 Tax=Helicobacter sp. TaxID=218 RepID=UPI0025C3B55F|nr:hypothetical protein [Helicobacter sp.]MCI5968219.1 hypothetical protein [Helicobacter sp.]MDY2584915.1 hypothetical protein [Helicobacter sp.]